MEVRISGSAGNTTRTATLRLTVPTPDATLASLTLDTDELAGGETTEGTDNGQVI